MKNRFHSVANWQDGCTMVPLSRSKRKSRMMPILIMFATQFRVAQAEAAAELFLSSVSSVITMGGFIALTSQHS